MLWKNFKLDFLSNNELNVVICNNLLLKQILIVKQLWI